MRNTLDMTFYCRKCKVNRKGLAPIELAVSMNGERRFINLPVKMAPDRFEKQVASKTTNDTKKYLESVESQIKAFQIFLPIWPEVEHHRVSQRTGSMCSAKTYSEYTKGYKTAC